jgi:glycosyltransferase involved in cell wall biosynthesis
MPKVSLILYTCAYQSPRAVRLLGYFIQRGYDLHICTSRASHMKVQDNVEVEIEGKHYPTQAMLVPPWEGGLLKQAWRRTVFILRSAKAIREILPDCIVASDIEGLLAAHIAGSPKSKVLYDIHDSTGEKFYRLPKILVRLLVWIENRIIGSSDAIMIADERRASELLSRIVDHPNLVTISNSPSDLLEKIPKVEKVAPFGKLQVCLCGMLIPQRGLEIALEMARQCNNVHLVLCGMLRNPGAESAIRRNPNTTYLGNLPHLEALAQMKQSDVMLALYDPGIPGHRICAPNKLYESFMLGRPVMVNRGTGLESMIESDGTGYVIDYGLDGLIQACSKAHTERESTLPEIAKRAREVFESKYAWPANKATLDDLLHQLGAP